MTSSPSPFGQNEWLVEEMYRKFREDPSSVDPSWHEFLVDYSPEPVTEAAATNGAAPAAPATPAPAPPATPAPTPAQASPATPPKAADSCLRSKHVKLPFQKQAAGACTGNRFRVVIDRSGKQPVALFFGLQGEDWAYCSGTTLEKGA